MSQPTRATPPIIFSTSDDFFYAAGEELTATFGKATKIERLAHDTGRFTAPEITIAQVAEACHKRPLVFVQHLLQEADSLPTRAVAADMGRIAAPVLDLLRAAQIATPIALQVWAGAGTTQFRYRPDELRTYLATTLAEQGHTITRGQQSHILSVCLTPQQTIVGINRTADALTDWPGGRVGLSKGEGQISRAEFKLEELLKVFPVTLPTRGVALDLGASPGGWTHLLRERGLTVWAVDPANLDLRLIGDPAVHHAQTTAAAFLAQTDEHFDLALNDMRMIPEMSCNLLVQAAEHLKPDALAIVTLKLFQYQALADVMQALAILRQAYEIVHARQLSHNRHEVTVVARRLR